MAAIDALGDLPVGDAFFLRPFGDRQVERREPQRLRRAAPSTSHCSGSAFGGMQRPTMPSIDLVAHVGDRRGDIRRAMISRRCS